MDTNNSINVLIAEDDKLLSAKKLLFIQWL